MNKEFCINCGHKNLFEVSKPKFCAGCGKSFNTSMASSARKPTSRFQEEEEEEEYFEPNSYDIEKLKASIVAESNSNKKTLDELWSDPAPRIVGNQRASSSDPSGAEILKQTMKDCSRVKAAKEING